MGQVSQFLQLRLSKFHQFLVEYQCWLLVLIALLLNKPLPVYQDASVVHRHVRAVKSSLLPLGVHQNAVKYHGFWPAHYKDGNLQYYAQNLLQSLFQDQGITRLSGDNITRQVVMPQSLPHQDSNLLLQQLKRVNYEFFHLLQSSLLPAP